MRVDLGNRFIVSQKIAATNIRSGLVCIAKLTAPLGDAVERILLGTLPPVGGVQPWCYGCFQ